MPAATTPTETLAPDVPIAAPFVRDTTTWLAYFACFYLFSIQASLGPAMPYVRAERGLSYTVAGLHFTAVAVGALLMGLFASRVARTIGRRAAFWSSIAGISSGGLLFVIAGHALVSIFGAFLIGLSGSLLVIVVQADLAERHPVHRSVALVEINLACSTGTIVAAFGVGLASHTPFGWPLAFIAPMLLCAAVTLRRRSTVWSAGLPAEARHRGHMPLPRLFWILCLIAALSAAGEWCISYWGAGFLNEAADASKSEAAAMLSLFFIGITGGRLAGRRLVQSIPPSRLLLGSFCLAIVVFPLFWLAPVLPIRLLGLVLLGAGISNVYPAVSAIAAQLLPRQLDIAFSHLQVTGNLMILTAPLLLGLLGDAFGIVTAMAMLLPLITSALLLTIWLNRQDLNSEHRGGHS